MERRIQREMERRAEFRDITRHGVPLEQVRAYIWIPARGELCPVTLLFFRCFLEAEATFQNPGSLESSVAPVTSHGGYVNSLLRKAELTMLGKQAEIDVKARFSLDLPPFRLDLPRFTSILGPLASTVRVQQGGRSPHPPR